MALTTTLIEQSAPLRLPPSQRLIPEQFGLVCAENREAVLTLAADGCLVPMTLTGAEGARNGKFLCQLKLFANGTSDLKLFDSFTGFSLVGRAKSSSFGGMAGRPPE